MFFGTPCTGIDFFFISYQLCWLTEYPVVKLVFYCLSTSHIFLAPPQKCLGGAKKFPPSPPLTKCLVARLKVLINTYLRIQRVVSGLIHIFRKQRVVSGMMYTWSTNGVGHLLWITLITTHKNLRSLKVFKIVRFLNLKFGDKAFKSCFAPIKEL